MSGRTVRRVVVCGTKFGQVYLQAFRRPGSPFELAGILAQGSERSRACARYYRTPLFTNPDQLPGDVDAACVVIRGGLLGGCGAELSQRLLARGVHVLQEHPLHEVELAACLRAARRHGVVFQLNSFYVHVEPVRRFLAQVRELLDRQRPVYVDAACGFQVAYALLDILGQALGRVRPWGFAPLQPVPEDVRRLTTLDMPFQSMTGVLGGVPLTLRIQNQLDPADPDNYAHLLHRVTIGTDGGSLTLVGTHGPVVWSPRPDFPRDVRDESGDPHFAVDPARVDGTRGDDHLSVPSGTVLGPADGPDYREVFRQVWPAGVEQALRRLRTAVDAGEDPLRAGQYHLGLCRLWQEVTTRLGPPQLVDAGPPAPLGPAAVAAVAAAGDSTVEAEPSSAPALWLRTPVPRPAAAARLVCFPHAGGSASFFRRWVADVPPAVELSAVQYPGRLDRIGEDRLEDGAELAGRIAASLVALLDRPTVLFGHSMGATVAYAVALLLEEHGVEAPLRLVVSGRTAPHRQRPSDKHLQPDAVLWQEVGRLGGTEETALSDEELAGMMVPVLRSDYTLAETFRPGGRLLSCPVSAFVGDADPEVSVEEAASWTEVTDGPFELRVFAGDHFYLRPRQAEVVGEIVRQLNSRP